MGLQLSFAFSAMVLLCIVIHDSSANCGCNEANIRTICSWNTQTFGITKWSSEDRQQVFTEVAKHCSILHAEEIRDKSYNNAHVYEWGNRTSNESTHGPYGLVMSEYLGRSTYKEAYGWHYRKNEFIVNGTMQFNDSTDIFERPPHCVRFRKNGTDPSWKFVLCGLHTQPSNANYELGNMSLLIDAVKAKWNETNIGIIGDLNCDGSYMSEAKRTNLPLFHMKQYGGQTMYWLIDSDADTMIASDNAYDRFIISGDNLTCAIVPRTSKPYRFDLEQGLTYEQTANCSDHFPIETQLCY